MSFGINKANENAIHTRLSMRRYGIDRSSRLFNGGSHVKRGAYAVRHFLET